MKTIREVFGDIRGRFSGDRIIIHKYIDKKCVIGYYKNSLGVCFIMKSKTKYFAFMGSERYVRRIHDIKVVLNHIENTNEKKWVSNTKIRTLKDSFVFEELGK